MSYWNTLQQGLSSTYTYLQQTTGHIQTTLQQTINATPPNANDDDADSSPSVLAVNEHHIQPQLAHTSLEANAFIYDPYASHISDNLPSQPQYMYSHDDGAENDYDTLMMVYQDDLPIGTTPNADILEQSLQQQFNPNDLIINVDPSEIETSSDDDVQAGPQMGRFYPHPHAVFPQHTINGRMAAPPPPIASIHRRQQLLLQQQRAAGLNTVPNAHKPPQNPNYTDSPYHFQIGTPVDQKVNIVSFMMDSNFYAPVPKQSIPIDTLVPIHPPLPSSKAHTPSSAANQGSSKSSIQPGPSIMQLHTAKSSHTPTLSNPSSPHALHPFPINQSISEVNPMNTSNNTHNTVNAMLIHNIPHSDSLPNYLNNAGVDMALINNTQSSGGANSAEILDSHGINDNIHDSLRLCTTRNDCHDSPHETNQPTTAISTDETISIHSHTNTLSYCEINSQQSSVPSTIKSYHHGKSAIANTLRPKLDKNSKNRDKSPRKQPRKNHAKNRSSRGAFQTDDPQSHRIKLLNTIATSNNTSFPHDDDHFDNNSNTTADRDTDGFSSFTALTNTTFNTIGATTHDSLRQNTPKTAISSKWRAQMNRLHISPKSLNPTKHSEHIATDPNRVRYLSVNPFIPEYSSYHHAAIQAHINSISQPHHTLTNNQPTSPTYSETSEFSNTTALQPDDITKFKLLYVQAFADYELNVSRARAGHSKYKFAPLLRVQCVDAHIFTVYNFLANATGDMSKNKNHLVSVNNFIPSLHNSHLTSDYRVYSFIMYALFPHLRTFYTNQHNTPEQYVQFIRGFAQISSNPALQLYGASINSEGSIFSMTSPFYPYLTIGFSQFLPSTYFITPLFLLNQKYRDNSPILSLTYQFTRKWSNVNKMMYISNLYNQHQQDLKNFKDSHHDSPSVEKKKSEYQKAMRYSLHLKNPYALAVYPRSRQLLSLIFNREELQSPVESYKKGTPISLGISEFFNDNGENIQNNGNNILRINHDQSSINPLSLVNTTNSHKNSTNNKSVDLTAHPTQVLKKTKSYHNTHLSTPNAKNLSLCDENECTDDGDTDFDNIHYLQRQPSHFSPNVVTTHSSSPPNNNTPSFPPDSSVIHPHEIITGQLQTPGINKSISYHQPLTRHPSLTQHPIITTTSVHSNVSPQNPNATFLPRNNTAGKNIPPVIADRDGDMLGDLFVRDINTSETDTPLPRSYNLQSTLLADIDMNFCDNFDTATTAGTEGYFQANTIPTLNIVQNHDKKAHIRPITALQDDLIFPNELENYQLSSLITEISTMSEHHNVHDTSQPMTTIFHATTPAAVGGNSTIFKSHKNHKKNSKKRKVVLSSAKHDKTNNGNSSPLDLHSNKQQFLLLSPQSISIGQLQNDYNKLMLSREESMGNSNSNIVLKQKKSTSPSMSLATTPYNENMTTFKPHYEHGSDSGNITSDNIADEENVDNDENSGSATGLDYTDSVEADTTEGTSPYHINEFALHTQEIGSVETITINSQTGGLTDADLISQHQDDDINTIAPTIEVTIATSTTTATISTTPLKQPHHPHYITGNRCNETSQSQQSKLIRVATIAHNATSESFNDSESSCSAHQCGTNDHSRGVHNHTQRINDHCKISDSADAQHLSNPTARHEMDNLRIWVRIINQETQKAINRVNGIMNKLTTSTSHVVLSQTGVSYDDFMHTLHHTVTLASNDPLDNENNNLLNTTTLHTIATHPIISHNFSLRYKLDQLRHKVVQKRADLKRAEDCLQNQINDLYTLIEVERVHKRFANKRRLGFISRSDLTTSIPYAATAQIELTPDLLGKMREVEPFIKTPENLIKFKQSNIIDKFDNFAQNNYEMDHITTFSHGTINLLQVPSNLARMVPTNMTTENSQINALYLIIQLYQASKDFTRDKYLLRITQHYHNTKEIQDNLHKMDNLFAVHYTGYYTVPWDTIPLVYHQVHIDCGRSAALHISGQQSMQFQSEEESDIEDSYNYDVNAQSDFEDSNCGNNEYSFQERESDFDFEELNDNNAYQYEYYDDNIPDYDAFFAKVQKNDNIYDNILTSNNMWLAQRNSAILTALPSLQINGYIVKTVSESSTTTTPATTPVVNNTGNNSPSINPMRTPSFLPSLASLATLPHISLLSNHPAYDETSINTPNRHGNSNNSNKNTTATAQKGLITLLGEHHRSRENALEELYDQYFSTFQSNYTDLKLLQPQYGKEAFILNILSEYYTIYNKWYSIYQKHVIIPLKLLHQPKQQHPKQQQHPQHSYSQPPQRSLQFPQSGNNSPQLSNYYQEPSSLDDIVKKYWKYLADHPHSLDPRFAVFYDSYPDENCTNCTESDASSTCSSVCNNDTDDNIGVGVSTPQLTITSHGSSRTSSRVPAMVSHPLTQTIPPTAPPTPATLTNNNTTLFNGLSAPSHRRNPSIPSVLSIPTTNSISTTATMSKVSSKPSRPVRVTKRELLCPCPCAPGSDRYSSHLLPFNQQYLHQLQHPNRPKSIISPFPTTTFPHIMYMITSQTKDDRMIELSGIIDEIYEFYNTRYHFYSKHSQHEPKSSSNSASSPISPSIDQQKQYTIANQSIINNVLRLHTTMILQPLDMLKDSMRMSRSRPFFIEKMSFIHNNNHIVYYTIPKDQFYLALQLIKTLIQLYTQFMMIDCGTNSIGPNSSDNYGEINTLFNIHSVIAAQLFSNPIPKPTRKSAQSKTPSPTSTLSSNALHFPLIDSDGTLVSSLFAPGQIMAQSLTQKTVCNIMNPTSNAPIFGQKGVQTVHQTREDHYFSLLNMNHTCGRDLLSFYHHNNYHHVANPLEYNDLLDITGTSYLNSNTSLNNFNQFLHPTNHTQPMNTIYTMTSTSYPALAHLRLANNYTIANAYFENNNNVFSHKKLIATMQNTNSTNNTIAPSTPKLSGLGNPSQRNPLYKMETLTLNAPNNPNVGNSQGNTPSSGNDEGFGSVFLEYLKHYGSKATPNGPIKHLKNNQSSNESPIPAVLASTVEENDIHSSFYPHFLHEGYLAFKKAKPKKKYHLTYISHGLEDPSSQDSFTEINNPYSPCMVCNISKLKNIGEIYLLFYINPQWFMQFNNIIFDAPDHGNDGHSSTINLNSTRKTNPLAEIVLQNYKLKPRQRHFAFSESYGDIIYIPKSTPPSVQSQSQSSLSIHSMSPSPRNNQSHSISTLNTGLELCGDMYYNLIGKLNQLNYSDSSMIMPSYFNQPSYPNNPSNNTPNNNSHHYSFIDVNNPSRVHAIHRKYSPQLNSPQSHSDSPTPTSANPAYHQTTYYNAGTPILNNNHMYSMIYLYESIINIINMNYFTLYVLQNNGVIADDSIQLSSQQKPSLNKQSMNSNTTPDLGPTHQNYLYYRTSSLANRNLKMDISYNDSYPYNGLHYTCLCELVIWHLAYYSNPQKTQSRSMNLDMPFSLRSVLQYHNQLSTIKSTSNSNSNSNTTTMRQQQQQPSDLLDLLINTTQEKRQFYYYTPPPCIAQCYCVTCITSNMKAKCCLKCILPLTKLLCANMVEKDDAITTAASTVSSAQNNYPDNAALNSIIPPKPPTQDLAVDFTPSTTPSVVDNTLAKTTSTTHTSGGKLKNVQSMNILSSVEDNSSKHQSVAQIFAPVNPVPPPEPLKPPTPSQPKLQPSISASISKPQLSHSPSRPQPLHISTTLPISPAPTTPVQSAAVLASPLPTPVPSDLAPSHTTSTTPTATTTTASIATAPVIVPRYRGRKRPQAQAEQNPPIARVLSQTPKFFTTEPTSTDDYLRNNRSTSAEADDLTKDVVLNTPHQTQLLQTGLSVLRKSAKGTPRLAGMSSWSNHAVSGINSNNSSFNGLGSATNITNPSAMKNTDITANPQSYVVVENNNQNEVTTLLYSASPPQYPSYTYQTSSTQYNTLNTLSPDNLGNLGNSITFRNAFADEDDEDYDHDVTFYVQPLLDIPTSRSGQRRGTGRFSSRSSNSNLSNLGLGSHLNLNENTDNVIRADNPNNQQHAEIPVDNVNNDDRSNVISVTNAHQANLSSARNGLDILSQRIPQQPQLHPSTSLINLNLIMPSMAETTSTNSSLYQSLVTVPHHNITEASLNETRRTPYNNLQASSIGNTYFNSYTNVNETNGGIDFFASMAYYPSSPEQLQTDVKQDVNGKQ